MRYANLQRDSVSESAIRIADRNAADILRDWPRYAATGGTVKLSSLAAFSPPAATAKSLILSL